MLPEKQPLSAAVYSVPPFATWGLLMQPPTHPTLSKKNVAPYTSVVTLALALVTLTPNCFARAMMSIRFRDETLWAILWRSAKKKKIQCQLSAALQPRLRAGSAVVAVHL